MRVDFYLLASIEQESLWLFACRLLAKAYLQNKYVFIYCNSQEEAAKLDNLLWTFADNSFIPHKIEDTQDNFPAPLIIGYPGKLPSKPAPILLNLNIDIPILYPRLERIMEIVLNEKTNKAICRKHFRQYRACEYELHTHNIGQILTATEKENARFIK